MTDKSVVIHKQSWPEPKLKYREDMPGKAYKVLSQGKGMQEVAYELKIAKDTLYQWLDMTSPRYKPELADAIKEGLIAAEVWWREQGRSNLNSRTFSPTLWYMNMRNRYGWRDTVDLTTDGSPITFANNVPRPQ